MSKLEDYEIALAHFDDAFASHGPTVKALSWGSEASQRRRFEALSEIGDLKGCRVLDVGCGFGDLFDFLLKEKGGVDDYLGVDINEKMLEVASARYPEARFLKHDILAGGPSEDFDYVFASGIFSLNSSTWPEFMQEMLTRMYELASKGVAVNFLSGYTTGQKFDVSRYPYPAEVLDFVTSRLTRRFVLRHDYMPNDFTVYMFKP